jgi:hypothetical protein
LTTFKPIPWRRTGQYRSRMTYNVQETVELHRMDPRHFGSSEFPIEYPCDRMLA